MLFPLQTLKLLTWQPHAQQVPYSANRDLIQADACEETPPFLPILGEKQWQQWPQAKPAMECFMQDPDQNPAHHKCHRDRSRASPYNLVSLAALRALLYKCPYKGGADSDFSPLAAAFVRCPNSRCCGPHSQSESHGSDESRLHPTSHLSQTKNSPDPPQMHKKPEQKCRTWWKGPIQTAYVCIVSVEQASFIFLVGVGEISSGFNSSQQLFDLLTWRGAEADQC